MAPIPITETQVQKAALYVAISKLWRGSDELKDKPTEADIAGYARKFDTRVRDASSRSTEDITRYPRTAEYQDPQIGMLDSLMKALSDDNRNIKDTVEVRGRQIDPRSSPSNTSGSSNKPLQVPERQIDPRSSASNTSGSPNNRVQNLGSVRKRIEGCSKSWAKAKEALQEKMEELKFKPEFQENVMQAIQEKARNGSPGVKDILPGISSLKMDLKKNARSKDKFLRELQHNAKHFGEGAFLAVSNAMLATFGNGRGDGRTVEAYSANKFNLENALAAIKRFELTLKPYGGGTERTSEIHQACYKVVTQWQGNKVTSGQASAGNIKAACTDVVKKFSDEREKAAAKAKEAMTKAQKKAKDKREAARRERDQRNRESHARVTERAYDLFSIRNIQPTPPTTGQAQVASKPVPSTERIAQGDSTDIDPVLHAKYLDFALNMGKPVSGPSPTRSTNDQSHSGQGGRRRRAKSPPAQEDTNWWGALGGLTDLASCLYRDKTPPNTPRSSGTGGPGKGGKI